MWEWVSNLGIWAGNGGIWNFPSKDAAGSMNLPFSRAQLDLVLSFPISQSWAELSAFPERGFEMPDGFPWKSNQGILAGFPIQRHCWNDEFGFFWCPV